MNDLIIKKITTLHIVEETDWFRNFFQYTYAQAVFVYN